MSGFRVLRAMHRPTAAKFVTRLFAGPAGTRARVGERDPRGAGGAAYAMDKRIACYLWTPTAGSGEGEAPTALLVHGWEGRGTQLGRFVDPLRAAGFRVVAFDHVGHEGQRRPCLLLSDDADTLRTIAADLFGDESAGPDLVVAHSMGSLHASLLLADGWSHAAVYVSPPDDLLVYFGHYLDLVTGDTELLPDMIALMERRFGERVEDCIPPARRVPRPGSADPPLEGRPGRPIEAGRFVAAHWAGARLVELDGLGHRRILGTPRWSRPPSPSRGAGGSRLRPALLPRTGRMWAARARSGDAALIPQAGSPMETR